MKFKYFLSALLFITLINSGCLTGKKLTNNNKTSPEPTATASNKSSPTGRVRKKAAQVPKKKEQKVAPSSGTSNSAPAVKKKEKKDEEKSKNVVTAFDMLDKHKNKKHLKDGEKRKSAFQSKSMCALEPVHDWYYSFAPDAKKTFTKCKSYPPEANYIKYLDKQPIHEVGELNRKVMKKNTKGVMQYAVATGEVVSQICFNQEGDIVAAKVLECSSNYDYLRLEGFQEALLGYKWSENPHAEPIECMKHFFSTTMN